MPQFHTSVAGNGTVAEGTRATDRQELSRKWLGWLAAGQPVGKGRRRTGSGFALPGCAGFVVLPQAVAKFRRELENLAAAIELAGRACTEPGPSDSLQNLPRPASAMEKSRSGSGRHGLAIRWEVAETFPRVYTACAGGETGGFLDLVLAQIADFQAREKSCGRRSCRPCSIRHPVRTGLGG